MTPTKQFLRNDMKNMLGHISFFLIYYNYISTPSEIIYATNQSYANHIKTYTYFIKRMEPKTRYD